MSEEMHTNELVDFINNAQPDIGWWHIVPSLNNQEKEKRFYDLFPPTNESFGINTIAMSVFLQEIGWHRQHGKNFRIDQRIIEDSREKVSNRSHFEVSLAQIDGARNVSFVKIGEADGSPASIFKSHRQNPRRFHPLEVCATEKLPRQPFKAQFLALKIVFCTIVFVSTR